MKYKSNFRRLDENTMRILDDRGHKIIDMCSKTNPHLAYNAVTCAYEAGHIGEGSHLAFMRMLDQIGYQLPEKEMEMLRKVEDLVRRQISSS